MTSIPVAATLKAGEHLSLVLAACRRQVRRAGRRRRRPAPADDLLTVARVAVDPTTDVARFREDDADELIVASFACPWCLAAAADVAVLHDNGNGAAATCACRCCDARWWVLVDAAQLLRLTRLAGPRAISNQPTAVRFGGDWL